MTKSNIDEGGYKFPLEVRKSKQHDINIEHAHVFRFFIFTSLVQEDTTWSDRLLFALQVP